MNTPAHSDDDLRCAEYVLGVMEADERRALERDALANPGVQARLAFWQNRLTPLTEDLPHEAPPDWVWQRVEEAIRPTQPSATTRATPHAPPGGLWDSLPLWRWLGIGASVAALALLAVALRFALPGGAPTQSASLNYRVATIARQDGVAHWTATLASQQDQLLIVPATRPTIAENKVTELWLVQGDAKPVPLGVFDPAQPVTIPLSRTNAAALRGAAAILAVSLEPPGGSPTGQPTGPVIATGALHPA
ncbi:anti-sigma factor [Pandoraea anapnoica]|uniref:Anti-sigma factor n=1 Tax=Pandoraea anapnoica TaxID=2508301 RepID=A0A5E4ZM15_9BURK|nr:anti-sigma factor [Pandoraea anapnoica]VVE61462.1 anti-sigma factor [Pandoraea anapnoica]